MLMQSMYKSPMHVIPNMIPYLLVLVLSTWCLNVPSRLVEISEMSTESCDYVVPLHSHKGCTVQDPDTKVIAGSGH
jgi:hypothetical protein